MWGNVYKLRWSSWFSPSIFMTVSAPFIFFNMEFDLVASLT